MTVIFCLEDRGGLCFGGKRVSRDKAVYADIVSCLDGARLRLSPESAPLFEGLCTPLVSENFLHDAGERDVCFVETCDPAPFLDRADRVILYRWNRRYPADFQFDESALSAFHLTDKREFAGNSHPVITKECFER